MQRMIIVEANKVEGQYWKDVWSYRELFFILALRDIAVQYKQTVVGILWAVLRPLLTMLAFTFVFSKVAKLPSGDIPYPLLVYAAMLPWQLFSSSFSSTANSLVANSNLVSKVYFPRLLVPASTVGVAIIDLLISLTILAALMLWYSFIPPLQVVMVLPLAVLAGGVALGPGLLLCSLNVTYRDFRYILPFVTQFGLYVSPVGFSSSIVPEQWQTLFMLNPMVGVIDGFRWALLGNIPFPAQALAYSVVGCVVFLIVGIYVFRKTEKKFADVI